MRERFYSLDVFRGATVALMILVNNPGSWSHIYYPLEHAPWHGATPTEAMTHIAIGTNTNIGGAVWLKPVTDEEYHSGEKQ